MRFVRYFTGKVRVDLHVMHCLYGRRGDIHAEHTVCNPLPIALLDVHVLEEMVRRRVPIWQQPGEGREALDAMFPNVHINHFFWHTKSLQALTTAVAQWCYYNT